MDGHKHEYESKAHQDRAGDKTAGLPRLREEIAVPWHAGLPVATREAVGAVAVLRSGCARRSVPVVAVKAKRTVQPSNSAHPARRCRRRQVPAGISPGIAQGTPPSDQFPRVRLVGLPVTRRVPIARLDTLRLPTIRPDAPTVRACIHSRAHLRPFIRRGAAPRACATHRHAPSPLPGGTTPTRRRTLTLPVRFRRRERAPARVGHGAESRAWPARRRRQRKTPRPRTQPTWAVGEARGSTGR